jgi:hypothetical protein
MGVGRVRGIRVWGFVVVAGLLAACSNNDGDGNGDKKLSGVAAIGAPISGGTVDLNCSNGSIHSTTTAPDGAWEVTVAGGSLPCGLRVSGGTLPGGANTDVFYSFAETGGSGTVNITPLTSLAVAQALGGGTTPAAWFAGSAAGMTGIEAEIADARSTLLTAMGTQGFELPPQFNPFSTPFTAVAGNPYDDLLESFAQAIMSLGFTYEQIQAAYAESVANLPPRPGSDSDRVAYDGQILQPSIVDYGSEPCLNSYNVFAKGLGGVGEVASLLVRIGAAAPAAGTVSLPIGALQPGVGTTGPVAAGKVQLYLYFHGDNQWTDDSATGNVQIVFNGAVVRVSAANVVLKNGKSISFDLSANYAQAEACEEGPNETEQAVAKVKELAGTYSLRLLGGACASPLAAANTAFTGSLVIDAEGGMRVVDTTDDSHVLAIAPGDENFTVQNAPSLHYRRGDAQIRLLDNPGQSSSLKTVQVKDAGGCDAYLRVSNAATPTGEVGSNDGAALAGADGVTATVNGSAMVHTAGLLAYGAEGDGTLTFNVYQLKNGVNEVDGDQAWMFTRLPTAVGKHDCTTMRIQFKNGANNLKDVYSTFGAATCTLEVLSADYAGSTITARFNARLENYANPSQTIVITDGYLRRAP